MHIELMACEAVIENECSHRECTQADVAKTYAMALVSSWPTDWARANAAILKRWPKGLERVKKKAHRIVEERRKAALKSLAERN